MTKESLKFITINRDATAVNRGFYYQYLTVLYKWVVNYIEERESQVYTEVDDDIKEVADRLIFTQVKCYSTSFSFHSKEIQKTLFNFFGLYLQEIENSLETRFVFQTNTSLSVKETLLSNWVANEGTLSAALLSDCVKKTGDVIRSEMKKLRDNQLSSSSLTFEKRETIKSAFNDIQLEVTNSTLEDFVKRIHWEFLEMAPDMAVESLCNKILVLLKHDRFESKPVNMLMEVLLSEIYRCSQKSDKRKRLVNNHLLTSILAQKTNELNDYINRKFLDLMDARFGPIYQAIYEMQGEINGLKYQIGSKPALNEIPQRITSLPHLNVTSLKNIQGDCDNLHEKLNTHKHIYISGIGGVGKSTLAKFYVQKYQDKFDHVIWLDAQPGILKALIFEQDLKANLALKIDKSDDEEKFFKEALRVLNQVPGNNILVVDDFKDDKYLSQLKSLNHWKLLLTSRKKYAQTEMFLVSPLSFLDAKQLFENHAPQVRASEIIHKEFFEMVEYNPLVIEITAKTISNSLDLSLEKFIELLKNQELDDNELKIDIDIEEDSSARILQILLKTFDISELGEDAYFMEFLAVLPSAIKITDLVVWYGEDYASENKVAFANLTNRLHQKGWIERDGDNIYVHRMLQETILYKMREPVNGFITLMFQLNWLERRIREGIDSDYPQALLFLRYGESILIKIKEQYRTSIYQPLLLVENEVLNVYNWIIGNTNLSERFASLLSRAIGYLGPEDSFVGIIHNNLGLALAERNHLAEAEKELTKAYHILKNFSEKAGTQLLYTICNLAMLYIRTGNANQFSFWFDEGMAIRKRNKLYDEPSFPFQCNLLAFAQQSSGNLKDAIRLFEIAITSHQQLPAKNKNDLNLVLYLNNLSYCCFLDNRHERAVAVISQAVISLRKLNVTGDNKLIVILISTLINITEKLGTPDELSELIVELEAIKKT